MAGGDEEVDAERLHVDGLVRHRLRAVEQDVARRPRGPGRRARSTGFSVPRMLLTWTKASTLVRSLTSASRSVRSSRPSSVSGSQRSVAPVRSQSICHGTRLEWCSISVTQTSSPGPSAKREPAAALPKRVGDQVVGLGGVLGEHDLVRVGRAEERARPCRAPPRRRRWPPATACARRGGRCCSAARRRRARRRAPGAACASWRRCRGRRADARRPAATGPGSRRARPRRRRCVADSRAVMPWSPRRGRTGPVGRSRPPAGALAASYLV